MLSGFKRGDSLSYQKWKNTGNLKGLPSVKSVETAEKNTQMNLVMIADDGLNFIINRVAGRMPVETVDKGIHTQSVYYILYTEMNVTYFSTVSMFR